MSSQLANVSSKKARKALKRLGFEDHPNCGGRGSHQTMVRQVKDAEGNVLRTDALTLVLGKDEINPFTLKGTLSQGNVSVEEFLDAF